MPLKDLVNSANFQQSQLLSMTICYGQSYEKANTMSSEISGLQKREVVQRAHNLNLVFIHAVSSNIQTSQITKDVC